jgi:predicted DCC family thiol-disulfide oxidoreductase YuxK
MADAPNPIILYDGVCGLCNRLVQFVMRHDRDDLFRFAQLQRPLAAATLQHHGLPADLNTVYVVLNHGRPTEQLLARSDAAIFILRKLGRRWALSGNFASLLPPLLRDAAYNMIARNRYRIWGKYDTCPLPDPAQRHKFVDEPSPPDP